ncbi:MAG: hypothetical protein AB1324_04240 [Candidatus Micrarchaeota archaeon]
MERPDIGTPIGPGKSFRLVARTQDIAEADRVAEQYRLQGFETKIVKKAQGALAVFEVWAAKEPDIITGAD